MAQQITAASKSSQAVAALAEMDTAEINQRVLSSVRQSGLSVGTVKCPTQGQRMTLTCSDTATAKAAAEVALRAVNASLTPTPANKVAQMIAALSSITARRKSDDLESDLAMEIMVGRLSQYPIDALKHVMLRQRHKFFPTLAELEGALDEVTATRRGLKWRLDRIASGLPIHGEGPLRDDNVVTVSKERAEQIMAEVLGDGGHTVRAFGGREDKQSKPENLKGKAKTTAEEIETLKKAMADIQAEVEALEGLSSAVGAGS